jgi:hypothetical protein
MITFASCDARLDFGEYHGRCIFSPRHSDAHFDGLYYWETGKPSERQVAGARAAKVLGLVRRRRPRRAEVVVEFSLSSRWRGGLSRRRGRARTNQPSN